MSGHCTDDELIDYLYGLDSGREHVDSCPECQQRLSAMRVRRAEVEAAYAEGPGFDLMAAQRRSIYARLSRPMPWWSAGRWPRWAPAALAIVVLGGGVAIYQENQTPASHLQQQAVHSKVSDAQLAADVSSMADQSEPQPAAPLEAFFQE
jgi:hypothetical protein